MKSNSKSAPEDFSGEDEMIDLLLPAVLVMGIVTLAVGCTHSTGQFRKATSPEVRI
jgi:hypothetical protein